MGICQGFVRRIGVGLECIDFQRFACLSQAMVVGRVVGYYEKMSVSLVSQYVMHVSSEKLTAQADSWWIDGCILL